MLSLIVLLASWRAIGQQTVRQGNVLKVHAPVKAAEARMNGITIPLFRQPDGGSLGLMPVDAELHPGEYPLEFLDASGTVSESLTVIVTDAHFHKDNVIISRALTELKSTPDDSRTIREFQAGVSSERWWQEPFQLPVRGCMNTPFGSGRLYNGKPTGVYHRGVDQRGAPGTPIHAVAAGTVRLVRQLTVSGGTIGIDHGQGLKSLYMHQSLFAVKEGQHVEAGDIIGYVGSTGRSTGPHLHWALYANGHAVNPGQWVTLRPCGASSRPKTRKKS